MSLLRSIKRLEYANFLIKKKATGDLATFSAKMKLSKSAVKELIQQMREMGAIIAYDRTRKSYYYQEDGEFCISKFMKYGEVLTKDAASNMGRPEDLCFSEKAVFMPCPDV